MHTFWPKMHAYYYDYKLHLYIFFNRNVTGDQLFKKCKHPAILYGNDFVLWIIFEIKN